MAQSFELPGTITAVNADGTYDVNVKNRAEDYPSVQSTDKNTYVEGDSVNVIFLNGNTNIPYINGAGTVRA